MDVVLDRVRRGQADLSGVDPRLAPLLPRRCRRGSAGRPHADEIVAALDRYAAGAPAAVTVPAVRAHRGRRARPHQDPGAATTRAGPVRSAAAASTPAADDCGGAPLRPGGAGGLRRLRSRRGRCRSPWTPTPGPRRRPLPRIWTPTARSRTGRRPGTVAPGSRTPALAARRARARCWPSPPPWWGWPPSGPSSPPPCSCCCAGPPASPTGR